MRKIFALVMVFLMLFLLSSCKEKPIISDEISDIDINATENKTDTNTDYYNDKVYYVGDDIPVGTYLIHCTGTEYSMDAVVFSSETDYRKFLEEDWYTWGEYVAAIEAYAWADFTLTQDESAYISLTDGNVIWLDKGKCEFVKYDIISSDKLYSGLYVVGQDINSQNWNISSPSGGMQVTLFEDRESYLVYHKADRFTVGEEAEAIKKYAYFSKYLYKGNSTSVKLVDGMILMVEDNVGRFVTDDGPVIK